MPKALHQPVHVLLVHRHIHLPAVVLLAIDPAVEFPNLTAQVIRFPLLLGRQLFFLGIHAGIGANRNRIVKNARRFAVIRRIPLTVARLPSSLPKLSWRIRSGRDRFMEFGEWLTAHVQCERAQFD